MWQIDREEKILVYIRERVILSEWREILSSKLLVLDAKMSAVSLAILQYLSCEHFQKVQATILQGDTFAAASTRGALSFTAIVRVSSSR